MNLRLFIHSPFEGHLGCFHLLSILSKESEREFAQSCLTLCDPMDGSPPGYPIPGILQARILEWVVISFSSASKWKVKVKSLSHVQPSATPWTVVFQARPSMEFSRQEYCSGVPLPSPRKLLELINEYSKVAGYKISTQKSVAFLYTNNEKIEKEIKETIPLQIQCNPYQATSGIFHRARTNNFTMCMEIQKTLNSQSNLEKEKWNLEESTCLTSGYTTKQQSSRQYGTGTKTET